MTVASIPSPALPRARAVAAFTVGAAALAAASPLLAYAGSLALFGAPHALAELRYVDGRFAPRLGRARGGAVAALLLAAVALRATALAGAWNARDAYVVELGLVAVLAFTVVPELASRPARAALALGVGVAIATGSAVAPWTTIVVLSILHNATPVGFLAERLRGEPARRGTLRACALLFVAVPALVATVVASGAPAAVGLAGPDETSTATGPLADHLRVFVPTAWVERSIARPLFAACAFLQLLHYGIVLGVLPRLLGGRGAVDAPRLPWPRGRVLAIGIAAVGAVFAGAFARDFAGTRATYGLLAAVHAWLELPVLLLALAVGPAAGLRPAAVAAGGPP